MATGMTKARDAICLKVNLLDGAGATTDIAVTGITTTCVIVSALVFTTKASIASCADLTSECSITSDGNIQFASTSTASNQVLLMWLDTAA